jgi:hypothetical protein
VITNISPVIANIEACNMFGVVRRFNALCVASVIGDVLGDGSIRDDVIADPRR